MIATTSLRQQLEEQFGQVWDTQQLQQDFTVQGFCLGFVVVQRKDDQQVGSLDFTHNPRFYHSFQADD